MLRLHSPSSMLSDFSRECGSMALPMANIGVFDCDWRQQMSGSARLRNHIAYLSLTPQPKTIRVAAEASAHRFKPVSDTGIFPAGQQLQAQLGGGRQQLLLCRLSPHHFDALLGQPMRWHGNGPTAAMSLRSPEVRQLMARMAQEILSPGMASQALLEGLCQALVIEIARDVQPAQALDQPSLTGRLTTWQMRRLQERLSDTVDASPPSVTEAATLCGVSARHLMRLFKATTGQTLHQWIAAHQIDLARRWLACTDRPLKAIAAELGFRHPASFSTAFNRECGEPPSAYRARLRQSRI